GISPECASTPRNSWPFTPATRVRIPLGTPTRDELFAARGAGSSLPAFGGTRSPEGLTTRPSAAPSPSLHSVQLPWTPPSSGRIPLGTPTRDELFAARGGGSSLSALCRIRETGQCSVSVQRSAPTSASR